MQATLRRLLDRPDTASGLFLVTATVAALLVANSPLQPLQAAFLELPVVVAIGGFTIDKPLLLWVNDGLMALFFLLVGLELKREATSGSLSTPGAVAFPAVAAVGGMLVPALLYWLVNQGDPMALRGWAIPAATDIAFALAVLALLGDRIPAALRVFLVTVAIFDDVGAIAVIALFYTSDMALGALAIAGACLLPLWWLNRNRVQSLAPYLLIGVVMWAAMLQSGVHATLAGVVLALFIPTRGAAGSTAPATQLEHGLHNTVAFAILPLFAFANAGLVLGGIGLADLTHPVTLGIIAGLVIGKQVGILGSTWLGVRLGLLKLPQGLTWTQVHGAAALCGIGFTMSLFIGSLAFAGADIGVDERLGILLASLLSGAMGWWLLRRAAAPRPVTDQPIDRGALHGA